MIELCCPVCREPLIERHEQHDHGDRSLFCVRCVRAFPIVAGIPDLRTNDDRYLSLEGDRAKASRLAAVAGGVEEVARAYWSMTPEVPDALAQQYVAHTVDGLGRGSARLDAIAPDPLSLIDVGCGTGGLVAAAAQRGVEVIGVDIALRWLVVARARLREMGLDDTRLVAADGAQLPFATASVQRAMSIDTLAHAAQPAAFVSEMRRVVQPGGDLQLVAANRYTMLPESTVGLWGVGLLPRRRAAAYVRRRRGTSYDFVRPSSRRELRSYAIAAGMPEASISAAAVPTVAQPSDGRRLADAAYERIRSTALGNTTLATVGPFIELRWSSPAR